MVNTVELAGRAGMGQQTLSTEVRRRLRVPEAFEIAAALHRQGRLRDAEKLYRALLQNVPDYLRVLHCLGVICRQTARPEEAVALLEQAVTLDPTGAEARNDLGIALAELGRPQQALAHYETAIAIRPDFVDAYNNLGNALLALKRPEAAVARFEKGLALKPDTAELHNNLGTALAALNRHEYAIAHYRAALALGPNLAEADNNCGIALAALGRDGEAVASFEAAIAVKPDYADAHANLAQALVRLDRHEDAIAPFQAALAIEPDSAELRNSLGNALSVLERYTEAAAQYHKTLAVRPDFAEVHNNLGNALAALKRHQEAVPHFRRALALMPELVEVHNNLGGSLEALDQFEEALACYERAATDPENARAHNRLGSSYMTLGRVAEARNAFDRAVELAPTRADYHRSRVESRRLVAGDPHLAVMEELARDIGLLSAEQQIELNFALGKVYADLQQPERSFRHYLAGNALKRRQIVYDEGGAFARFERTAAVFTRELIERKQGAGDPSPVPVFIVGMPRSGTTLIEQVLASHPEVFGAGEISEFSKAIAGVCEPAGAAIPYPEMLPSMPASELRRVGAQYLAGIGAKAPVATRITDKALGNYQFAGLIHLALPNARIIHTRRDPIDTCLSCFSKLFAESQAFTYDLAELGRYYRAYERMMAHWRQVLPEGAMLEVQYEELVADFEPQARRIVAYCGLEWDAGCLAFHQTQRPVRTASMAQVRQPLYQSAVGRWRPYEPWLGPLLEALGR
jgi:tetratricopeptide (TPR) repeat protein